MMAKRKRGFHEGKYRKFIAEGRGIGEMEFYKPWINIQDVASVGRSSRILGIKTHRMHQFLSDNETNYFYILEYSDYVIDIREQYPLLPIEKTIEIATELGIRHPIDPITQVPIVMTTDFLITLHNDNATRYLARTIKGQDKLGKRQIEKFEIERVYWKQESIDWGIVTDKEINKVFSKNIAACHSLYDLSNKDGFENMTEDQIHNLVENFKEYIIGTKINIRDKVELFDKNRTLKPGTSILLFKHLIITKQIFVDMFNKLNLDICQDIRRDS